MTPGIEDSVGCCVYCVGGTAEIPSLGRGGNRGGRGKGYGNARAEFVPHFAVFIGAISHGLRAVKGARKKRKRWVRKKGKVRSADGPPRQTSDFFTSIPVWGDREKKESQKKRKGKREGRAGTPYSAWIELDLLDEKEGASSGKKRGREWPPAYLVPLGKFPIFALFTSQETAVISR